MSYDLPDPSRATITKYGLLTPDYQTIREGNQTIIHSAKPRCSYPALIVHSPNGLIDLKVSTLSKLPPAGAIVTSKHVGQIIAYQFSIVILDASKKHPLEYLEFVDLYASYIFYADDINLTFEKAAQLSKINHQPGAGVEPIAALFFRQLVSAQNEEQQHVPKVRRARQTPDPETRRPTSTKQRRPNTRRTPNRNDSPVNERKVEKIIAASAKGVEPDRSKVL